MTCPICASPTCLGECWPLNIPTVNTIGGTAVIEGKGVGVGAALYDRNDNIYGRQVVVVDAIVKKNFAGKPSLEVMAPGWPDSAPCVLEDLTWEQPYDKDFREWYEKKYGHKISSIIDLNHMARINEWHDVWVEARKEYNLDRDARGRMAVMFVTHTCTIPEPFTGSINSCIGQQRLVQLCLHTQI